MYEAIEMPKFFVDVTRELVEVMLDGSFQVHRINRRKREAGLFDLVV